jgi:hypothetical protein
VSSLQSAAAASDGAANTPGRRPAEMIRELARGGDLGHAEKRRDHPRPTTTPALSRFIRFSRDEWARLRDSTPLTLAEETRPPNMTFIFADDSAEGGPYVPTRRTASMRGSGGTLQ